MKLHPMISFHGNCREAFESYREIFGGETPFEGFPDAARMGLPCKLQNLVVRAKFQSEHFTLYGSDLGDNTIGGRISLLLTDFSVSEFRSVFDRLSADAKSASDSENVKSGQFAALIDRFGVEWVFYFQS